MCDYSLHGNATRLAEEGEQLVVHRFPTSSIGLASPSEIDKPTTRPAITSRTWWSWSAIKDWFCAGLGSTTVKAVCIPPGAKLVLRDIPNDLRQELSVGPEEEVTFVQLSASVNTYRDGVRFSNGRQVLLQRLREGQRADVLALSSEDTPAPEVLERRREQLQRLR
ncbi:MAG: hypothetical protein ACRD7E_28435 [Bryobacteraceae bacterium]